MIEVSESDFVDISEDVIIALGNDWATQQDTIRMNIGVVVLLMKVHLLCFLSLLKIV